MILFYANEITDTSALLEQDEYHHCCKVLRHKEGDVINITDGNGKRAKAVIDKVSKREAMLSITEQQFIEPSNNEIILVVAPPKNRSRWEWLIEKSVEIGVTEIIPLVTARSERQKVNQERSQKIMRSAALQSMRPYHPRLSPMMNFKSIIDNESYADKMRFLASFSAENSQLLDHRSTAKKALIMIGPEGDFTTEEITIAKQQGMTTVNISSNRLRTETAAIVAVTLLAKG